MQLSLQDVLLQRCRSCKEYARKVYHRRFRSYSKALFPRALRLQIGCGAEPTMSQNLLQLVKLGKQYGVKHITITTNGNLLTYEKLQNWWKMV